MYTPVGRNCIHSNNIIIVYVHLQLVDDGEEDGGNSGEEQEEDNSPVSRMVNMLKVNGVANGRN